MDLRIWWQKVVSFPPPKMCLRKLEYKKYFKISLLPSTKKVSLNNFVTQVNSKPDVFIIVVTQKLVLQQFKNVKTTWTEIPSPPSLYSIHLPYLLLKVSTPPPHCRRRGGCRHFSIQRKFKKTLEYLPSPIKLFTNFFTNSSVSNFKVKMKNKS